MFSRSHCCLSSIDLPDSSPTAFHTLFTHILIQITNLFPGRSRHQRIKATFLLLFVSASTPIPDLHLPINSSWGMLISKLSSRTSWLATMLPKVGAKPE